MITYLSIWGMVTSLLYIAYSGRFILSDRGKQILPVIAGLIYIVFAIFRDVTTNIGLDIYHYNLFFNRANMPFLTYLSSSTLEVGYTILEWILYRIFGDFRVLLLLVHSLVYLSTVALIQIAKIERYTFIWIACLTLELFTPFYLVRNSMAISIGIFVVIKLYRKKHLGAFVLSLIAITIHVSSIVLFFLCMISLIFNNRDKISKWRIIFFACLSVCAVYIVIPVLLKYVATDGKYHVYVTTGAIGLRFYLTGLLVSFFSINRWFKFKNDNFFSLSTVLLTGLFALIPLQLVLPIVYRMTLFFQPILFYLMIRNLTLYRRNTVSFQLIRLMGIMTLGVNLYTFCFNVVEYIGNPYIWAGF